MSDHKSWVRSKLRLNWRCYWNKLTEKLIDWYSKISKYLQILQNPMFVFVRGDCFDFQYSQQKNLPKQETLSTFNFGMGGKRSVWKPVEERSEEAKWLRLGNIHLFVQKTLRKGFSTHLAKKTIQHGVFPGFWMGESAIFFWGGTQTKEWCSY